MHDFGLGRRYYFRYKNLYVHSNSDGWSATLVKGETNSFTIFTEIYSRQARLMRTYMKLQYYMKYT